MQMYMYIHISFFFSFLFASRRVTDKDPKEMSIRQEFGQGSQAPAALSIRRDRHPLNFTFLLFTPHSNIISIISSHLCFLLVCLSVCLSLSSFFAGRQLQLWDSILRFPSIFAALFAAVFALLLFFLSSSSASFPLSLSLPSHLRKSKTKTKNKNKNKNKNNQQLWCPGETVAITKTSCQS